MHQPLTPAVLPRTVLFWRRASGLIHSSVHYKMKHTTSPSTTRFDITAASRFMIRIVFFLLGFIVAVSLLSSGSFMRDIPSSQPPVLPPKPLMTPASILLQQQQLQELLHQQQQPPQWQQRRLIFYNRPPKTGSTTIRIAFGQALQQRNQTAAKCFNRIEWNEMSWRTIVHRRDVDFYGCHTRLTAARHSMLAQLRGGNVTFVTSTRNATGIVLSAYLQENRDRNIAALKTAQEMDAEVESRTV